MNPGDVRPDAPADVRADAPADVTVPQVPVRLGQFLKLANLLASGAEAKRLVAQGRVRVDGGVELRRGRQLHGGEVVAVAGGSSARVVGAGAWAARRPG